ncbi:MAG TPA: tetratricopeptide repeat protein [Gemmatimonadota bacterium]|nr:tetratricopeptide repeat protein [Gemmatimonadota bacterium]
MESASQLKSRARRLESAGDFEEALELYEKALRRSAGDPDAMPDPTLQLRVADLHYRLERPGLALSEYERAAELYRELGLMVNAIAVWKKVARVYEDAPHPNRRLAELQLAMGLVADGRSSLRTFVEGCAGTDREEQAVEAMVEFLRASPDPEIATLLARWLGGRGSPPEAAVETLERTRRRLEDEGRAAAEFEQAMEEILGPST